MAERYRGRVAFFVVYIKEAHPEDGWVLATNRQEAIAVADPSSGEGRAEVAQACAVESQVGIAYGVSMLVLIRVRQQRRADEISEEVQLKLSDRGISTQPTVTPPTTTPVQNVAPPNGL